MIDLTDLEICKKIAEIENKYDELLEKQASYNSRLVHVQQKENITRWYNPLTDDGLCFKLMVKYKVTFESCQFYKNMFTAFTYSEYEIKVLPKAHEYSPNKAICLAIIEAHKND